MTYQARHAAPRRPKPRSLAALSLAALLTFNLSPASAAPATSQPQQGSSALGILADQNQPIPAQDAAALQEAEEALQELLQEQGVPAEALGQDLPDEVLNEDFYQVPQTLPQGPGQLVKSQHLPLTGGTASLNSLLAGSQKIMYTSTDYRGQQVAVTGVALTSNRPWTSPGNRPIIAFAPGTQGLGDSCAPSNQMEAGSGYENMAVAALLRAGYNVVITDYLGSGTAGTHSYLNRVDQGNALIDIARLATQSQELGLGLPNSPVGFWGYSQGGGASASAGELQPSYAPELNLKAVYAGAVPADLMAVNQKIDGSLYTAFSLMGLAGLADSYGVDLTGRMSQRGLEALDLIREQCTFAALGSFAFSSTKPLTASGQTLTQMVASDPEISAIMAENSLGAAGRAPKVPTLIASSWGDDVIPYRANKQLASRYCAAGTRVTFYGLATVTHVVALYEGIPRALIFMDRQFKDLPNINSCWRL